VSLSDNYLPLPWREGIKGRGDLKNLFNNLMSRGTSVTNRTIEVLVMAKIPKPKYIEKVMSGCFLTVIALGLLITGCASSQQTAFQTQLDLGSCGFQWKVADTPEKLKKLEALPQRKILRHEKDGKVYYIYADARDCKCVYVGDEKAYQQYKQFVYEQRQDRQLDIGAAETADMQNLWNWYSLGLSNY
jgi:hypothetical protein